jgi:hypothetical protein
MCHVMTMYLRELYVHLDLRELHFDFDLRVDVVVMFYVLVMDITCLGYVLCACDGYYLPVMSIICL